MKTQAILLPGVVLPARLAYGELIERLGDGVDARAKELELYATDQPPTGYDLATEASGVLRLAEEAGFESFHLVGYSAGGAVALYTTAARPERIRSLVLMEPAWAGRTGLGPAEEAVWERFSKATEVMDEAELMREFMALQLAPGTPLPETPSGPPPPWMAQRPAGIRAIEGAFDAAELDLAALGGFDRPVRFLLGGRSNPDYYGQMSERLAAVFPDYDIEVYAERHHFDPPHRAEPERVAESLRSFWARAGSHP